MLNAFGLSAPGGGETGTPKAALNTWGGIVAGGGGNGSSGNPKAFVNLLVFDKNYKFLDIGWDQINGGEQVGAEPKAAHDYMMQEYTAREEGYIYVYVSNENSTLVEVYFDDVTVTQTKSNLIQYNEYYPFGQQTAGSWTRENTLDNNFLANGGTELNKTSNQYDLEYRNYDQVIGRMNGVDPMSTTYASLTPYNYSFNDPVTFTDVSGAYPSDPWHAGPYNGSELHYYTSQGPDGRGPGQVPLTVQDPFWSKETGWTTEKWTWNAYQAGGYNMMAGAYSVPMAGRGLPPPDVGTLLTIDMVMFRENAETIVSVFQGETISAIELPYFIFKFDLNIETNLERSKPSTNGAAGLDISHLIVKLPNESLPTLLSPVGNATISSAFLAIRTCEKCSYLHGGTDYSVVDGTPVHATAFGRIVRASYSPGTGNTVIINHGASRLDPSLSVYTLYAHGSKFAKTSGFVGAGELIMYSGHSGEKVTGPHLHYEVIVSPYSPSDSRFYSEIPWGYRYGPESLRMHLYGPN